MNTPTETPSPRRSARWWLVLILAVPILTIGVFWYMMPGGIAFQSLRMTKTILDATEVKEENADRETILKWNNEGVGLMEQFQYPQAVEIFTKIVEKDPTWLPGRINLGIAQLNAGGTSEAALLKQTRETFENVLDIDPENIHGHFCLGVLLQYQKDPAVAMKHFEKVTELDPSDPSAWFFLGLLTEDPQRRAACFQNALKHDPYHIGANYQVALEMRRTDPAKGKELIEIWQKLKDSDWGNPAGIKYAEMGKYAEVISGNSRKRQSADTLPRFQQQAVKVTLSNGARWAVDADMGDDDAGKLRRKVRERFGATMVVLDFDDDGRPDLYLAGAVVEGGKLRDLLLHNTPEGFVDVTAKFGLNEPFPTLGVSVADVDNDGKPDLLLCGINGVRLFRNTGTKFENITTSAGLNTLTGVFFSGSFVDLDQDSDLDLVLCQYTQSLDLAVGSGTEDVKKGKVMVLLNTSPAPPADAGKKTPTPLQVRYQPVEDVPALDVREYPTQVVVADVDGDQDMDLIVMREGSQPIVILNDRLLRFNRKVPIAESGAWGGMSLDTTHTGRSDFWLTGPLALPRLYHNRAPVGEIALEKTAPSLVSTLQSSAVDINLDGWTDVVGLERDDKKQLSLRIYRNTGKGLLPDFQYSQGGTMQAITTLVRDPSKGVVPEILVWSTTGLIALRPVDLKNHGVLVQLRGRFGVEPTGTAVRCNRDGIGTMVIAQAGDHWTAVSNVTMNAGLGQSRQPLLLGLGRHKEAEVIRFRWPDNTWQAELKVASGLARIAEHNRKTTSCPILFTWDGTKFRFLTDFLGAGTMGEYGIDRTTRPPRPEESIKIPAEALVPREGRYLIDVAEPMDEVTYLDRLQLVAIDHPRGMQVYPDERFATDANQPTQKLLAFDRVIPPTQAKDHRGRDMTATLQKWDRNMVDGFARRSWLGFAEEHFVEMDFGSVDVKQKLVLCMAGWTDYAFPEAIWAANQANVSMLPPVLEQYVEGKWIKICDAGFPAGLPRMITLDVTGKLRESSKGCKLRLRTNLHVYWDQIYLAANVREIVPDKSVAKTAPSARTLEVHRADLSPTGIHREYTPDGKLPTLYAHDEFMNVPVGRLAGRLTRHGDVTELLHQRDDRFVIFGPGDVVRVQFDARGLPALPTGWERSFVLRTWGYCKDTGPFTAMSATVEPLPFAGMKQYPPGKKERGPQSAVHREYRSKYNSRVVVPERNRP